MVPCQAEWRLSDASRIRLALRVRTESTIGDFKCAAYYAHVFCPDRYHRPSGRYAPHTTHLFYVSFAREARSRAATHGVLRTGLMQWDRKSGLGEPMTDALRTCSTLSTVNGGGEGVTPHVLRTRLMHRSRHGCRGELTSHVLRTRTTDLTEKWRPARVTPHVLCIRLTHPPHLTPNP